MPLNYPSKTHVFVAPRGAVAFAACDGGKMVCCLVATATLKRHFADGDGGPAHQIFDRHRLVLEAAASHLYDEIGSDERGELILGDRELGRLAVRRGGPIAGDHARALSWLPPRPLRGALLPPDLRTTRW